jgi:hypothetical protein
MVNTRVDVVGHLEERMRRWLVVRMGQVIQPNLTETHLWLIARRIVASLVWEEKKAGARALASGEPWPRPQVYRPPATLQELLTPRVLERLPQLSGQTRAMVWDLFCNTLLPNIGGRLPLCPTNYGRGAESNE